MRYHYERDTPDPYPYPVRVKGGPAVAWYILGWQTEPDEDTEWTGLEVRTGWMVAVMVGDDRPELIEPDDILPLARHEYCGECGQIGCRQDGYDREDD